EGVSNANVNFALETINVSYNDNVVQPSDMIAKVKKLGYELRPKEDGPEKVDHKQAEIRKQTQKFIFSAILTLPLLWTMVAHLSFLSFIYLPDIFMNPWFQLVLATPVQFIIGAQLYKAPYTSLKNKSANMGALVVLDTSVEYFYGVFCAGDGMSHGSTV